MTTPTRKPAGRAGNHEGHALYVPDRGKWRVRVQLGGKPKDFWGETEAAARKLARKAADKFEDNGTRPTTSGKLTLGAYLTSWIAGEKGNLDEATWMTKEGKVRNHLVPTLGKVPITALTAAHVRDLYAKKRSEVGARGKPLSPSSLEDIGQLLRQALDAAVREHLVGGNVAKEVPLPRPDHPEIEYLSAAEAQRFIDAALAEAEGYGVIWLLGITTGMRRGELLAVHWADLDPDAGTMVVRENLKKKTAGTWRIGKTKTYTSRRTIRLTPQVIEALHAHRARQAELHLRQGPDWQDQDLVFCNRWGRPLIANNISDRNFPAFLARWGLRDIHFHGMRHTCATLLLSRGVAVKVVSEMLGHKDIATTLRIYGHVLPDMQAQAVAAWGPLFGEITPTTTPTTPRRTRVQGA